MNFLKAIWQKITWNLWGRRMAVRKIERLLDDNIKVPLPRAIALRPENRSLYEPIKYSDMNLEHYTKMAESEPREVLPPPDANDSGLN